MAGSQQLIGGSPLNLAKRPRTDVAAGHCFLAVCAVASCFCGYGAAFQNFAAIESGYESHCAADAPPSPPLLAAALAGPARRLTFVSPSHSAIAALAGSSWILGAVACFLILVGIAWIALLRSCAKPVVVRSSTPRLEPSAPAPPVPPCDRPPRPRRCARSTRA